MNTLIQFTHTPTGRTKMKEIFTDAKVSCGASSQGNATEWDAICIDFRANGDEPAGEPSYWLRMDRETAARVAQRITEYLAPKDA